MQGEEKKRGTLVAIDRPEGQCWIENLITAKKCYHKPTLEDLEHSLRCMREHAVVNRVLGIRLPRIACGKDFYWRGFGLLQAESDHGLYSDFDPKRRRLQRDPEVFNTYVYASAGDRACDSA